MHLLLVDGSGYIFRAFHALPQFTRSDKLPVGCVLGFCNMIFKLEQDLQGDDAPTHIAVVFDYSGRTFRDQIWMREEAFDGLRQFAAAVHADGARAAIQIGHAGWFSSPHATRTTPIGPSATFSPHAQCKARAMDESDFERVTGEFASAARLAVSGNGGRPWLRL